MAEGSSVPFKVLLLALFVVSCEGSFLITAPLVWIAGEKSLVCLHTPTTDILSGDVNAHVNVSVKYRCTSCKKENVKHDPVEVIELQVQTGQTTTCQEVIVPFVDADRLDLVFTGQVGGVDLGLALGEKEEEGKEVTRSVDLLTEDDTTFLQTDRRVYKPGQKVKIRLLTVHGTEVLVVTGEYSEIWVSTPSNTRVAQWKNVDNSAGLVHLSFQLADEPEQVSVGLYRWWEVGFYAITAKHFQHIVAEIKFEVRNTCAAPVQGQALVPGPYFGQRRGGQRPSVCGIHLWGASARQRHPQSVQRREEEVPCRPRDNEGGEGPYPTHPATPPQIAGCRDFRFTTAELRVLDCSVGTVAVEASVEEEGTGVRAAELRRVRVERQPYRFRVVHNDKYKKPNLPYTLKTRLTFSNGTAAPRVPVEVCAAGKCATMLSKEEGLVTVVVSAEKLNSVKMSTLEAGVDIHPPTFQQVIVPLFSPSNSSLAIQLPEGDPKCASGRETEFNLPVLFSANNQSRATLYVQVMSRGKTQKYWTEEVLLKAGKLPIDTNHLVDPPTPMGPKSSIVTGVLSLRVRLPPTASPTVKILIWYTREDGEVVSDMARVKVETCLGMRANIAWSEAKGRPGGNISLSLVSEPSAVCSLGVVDRSSELLAPRPSYLSASQFLLGHLDRYSWYLKWRSSQIDDGKYCARKDFEGSSREAHRSPPDSSTEYIYSSEYVDSLKMFDKSGLLVLSDLTLETRPCQKAIIDRCSYVGTCYADSYASDEGFSRTPSKGGPGQGAATQLVQMVDEEEGGQEGQEEVRLRTKFPDTWLWDLVVIPSDGASSLNLTLPDTITEWVGQAVCAHPQKGVGLSERASITAFTPFFTDLTLPPTVKRGEILPVKISVFNYLEESLPIRLTLEESSEYEVILENEEIEEETKGGGEGEEEEVGEEKEGEGDLTPLEAKNQNTTCVAPKEKAVHTFRIRLLALGEVNLTVSAFVDYSIPDPCRGGGGGEEVRRRDTLIKPIKVDAEGFLRERTWTKYVCAEGGEDAPETWQVAPPSNIVEGSDRGWVTAEGDLLALSIENLGSLIRMPFGCGEQNMVTFAPNVFVMQYLAATGQNTTENTERLIGFMRTGYQRQLLYRRGNGSYSAFGNADDSGSTWLTAFVLKSFAQAKDFLPIDEEALEQTRNWLLKAETVDGCFVSQGEFFQKRLQADAPDKQASIPLTAYVLISLLEAGTETSTSVVKNAIHCITSDSSTDPYTLALKAYALALARHTEGGILLRKLLDLAVVEKNAMYWKLPEETFWSNSLVIETAGYAVLAMMSLNPKLHTLQAREVIKWITWQRNGQGGFCSSQDTVVALQAMASYETYTHRPPLDAVATITADDFSHVFTISEENKLLQQLQTLPKFPVVVSVSVEGQGCAVLQAVLRYNIPEAEPSDAFSLRVTPRNDPSGGCVEKRLEACAAYLLPDGKSNMAVIEVNLVSGFIPEKDDLKAAVSRNPEVVKRYEVDGSKVTFYIEEFTAEEVCVSFRARREVEIEDAKPGTVVVYDYYQPEFSISEAFEFPSIAGCTR
ncbi:pregnancy zone protein-like [Penaeus japonicus]|uniref:pregnancy zone protein-like n=1 Tax=Penaeus japonicus TaxID=27405 RepID=UPI001C714D33|nr:pregnancy zone protein-like [Penaeus japonicus]